MRGETFPRPLWAVRAGPARPAGLRGVRLGAAHARLVGEAERARRRMLGAESQAPGLGCGSSSSAFGGVCLLSLPVSGAGLAVGAGSRAGRGRR